MDRQSNHLPWLEKGVSSRARYLSKLGLILIASVLIFPVGGIFVGLSYWLDSPADFWKEGFPILLISTTLTAVGVIVLRKSIITMRSPISFIPSYELIPARDPGFPIEVWYEKFMDGLGTIRFDASGLILRGNAPKPQGGMITSLVSLFQQRDEFVVQITYGNITELVIKGRRISFKFEYLMTHHQQTFSVRTPVLLYVSESDGERMYCELKKYFPSAVAEFIF